MLKLLYQTGIDDIEARIFKLQLADLDYRNTQVFKAGLVLWPVALTSLRTHFYPEDEAKGYLDYESWVYDTVYASITAGMTLNGIASALRNY